jgi:hypothetical protein
VGVHDMESVWVARAWYGHACMDLHGVYMHSMGVYEVCGNNAVCMLLNY